MPLLYPPVTDGEVVIAPLVVFVVYGIGLIFLGGLLLVTCLLDRHDMAERAQRRSSRRPLAHQTEFKGYETV